MTEITPINIFLLCYNESVLLPHTISHYKNHLPNCIITIYDNESTDNSVEIAKSLGCNIISWSSNNIINDYIYQEIKNNCWKSIHNGWIIMADMDEWLNITEDDLNYEIIQGTTILSINGIDIIGESNTIDLSDIDLFSIKKYVDNISESKKLCFLREKIIDIHYNLGAHKCDPKGIIKFSSKIYTNKHMSNLGLPFLINKMQKRYERSKLMRSKRLATHYTNDIKRITDKYNSLLCKSTT